MVRFCFATATITLMVFASAVSARIISHDLEHPKSNDNRIVNGYAAEEGQFPYQVSVLALTVNELYYVCGGSIITADWVLSAAHCTFPHRVFLLRFGSTQLWENGQLQRTTTVVNHPEYNQDTLNNDVSLLRIPTPLDLINGPLRAINLPGPELNRQLFVGNRSRVAGWGINSDGEYSTSLQFVDMEIIDNPTCRRVYGEELVIGGVLCAYGFNNRRQGICGGDSGSALAVRHNGEWVQVGIAAFGALDACERGFPSGFSRVTVYNAWIKETAGLPPDDNGDDEEPPNPDDSQEQNDFDGPQEVPIEFH